MKALVTLALAGLTAIPAAAQQRDDYPPVVIPNWHFRAYENGMPAGAAPGLYARRFSEVDTDRNGVWDGREIALAFRGAGLDVIMAFDANGDGLVTPLEVRAFTDGGTGKPDGVLFERVRG